MPVGVAVLILTMRLEATWKKMHVNKYPQDTINTHRVMAFCPPLCERRILWCVENQSNQEKRNKTKVCFHKPDCKYSKTPPTLYVGDAFLQCVTTIEAIYSGGGVCVCGLRRRNSGGGVWLCVCVVCGVRVTTWSRNDVKRGGERRASWLGCAHKC